MTTQRFMGAIWCALLFLACIALAACGPAKGRPATASDSEQIEVPISNPCATARPDRPVPMNERMTRDEFLAMSFKQRTALVARQSVEHQKYGEALGGATGACPEVEGE